MHILEKQRAERLAQRDSTAFLSDHAKRLLVAAPKAPKPDPEAQASQRLLEVVSAPRVKTESRREAAADVDLSEFAGPVLPAKRAMKAEADDASQQRKKLAFDRAMQRLGPFAGSRRQPSPSGESGQSGARAGSASALLSLLGEDVGGGSLPVTPPQNAAVDGAREGEGSTAQQDTTPPAQDLSLERRLATLTPIQQMRVMKARLAGDQSAAELLKSIGLQEKRDEQRRLQAKARAVALFKVRGVCRRSGLRLSGRAAE